MSEWVRLCGAAELPGEGHAKEIAAAGRIFCVACVEGSVSVMDNECPHRGGPLAEGTIEEGKIVCPWHAWAFDHRTGVASHNPHARVRVYLVKREGDDLYVQV